MNAQMTWATAEAPSIEDFRTLAAAAFADLPEQFRARCANIVFAVEDFPDSATMHELQLESPFDLLGVYRGVDESKAGGVYDVHDDLNRVILFRRPLLNYWAEHEETLGDLIAHVLIHEIGHHMGLSDAQMEAIEASVEE